MPVTRLKSLACIESITSNKTITRNNICTENFASEDLESACKNYKE